MIQDKIEQARKEAVNVKNSNNWSVSMARLPEPLYCFTKPELVSLLREVAAHGFHEGNTHARVKANQAGCSKEVDDAMYRASLDSGKWLNKNYPEPLNEDSDE